MQHIKWAIAIAVMTLSSCHVIAQGVTIDVHVRGVYGSKVVVQPLTGADAFKVIAEVGEVKAGTTASIQIAQHYLPGEFVLRFDYRETENSKPYPSEKRIFVHDQSIALWVNPLYISHPDSTWFQQGERENTAFLRFNEESARQKEKLGLLQHLLLNYGETESRLYAEAVAEFEKKRNVYNRWLTTQVNANKGRFVASVLKFQYVPPIDWTGSEAERVQSAIGHYFDGMDFNDPIITNTRQLREWIDRYVNLYGSLATSEQTQDSLLLRASQTAIEKAKTGHPKVYGWMVDYFFDGFERFGIPEGIAVLEPYLNDPECLTRRRVAFQKRLVGIRSLVRGSIAPDFTFANNSDQRVRFHTYESASRYKLVLFWSAACNHCLELVAALKPWHDQLESPTMVDIIALSVDDTPYDVAQWRRTIATLDGWTHVLTDGGVNSPEADAYSILSTPVMVLVDSKDNTILGLPENVEALKRLTQD